MTESEKTETSWTRRQLIFFGIGIGLIITGGVITAITYEVNGSTRVEFSVHGPPLQEAPADAETVNQNEISAKQYSHVLDMLRKPLTVTIDGWNRNMSAHNFTLLSSQTLAQETSSNEAFVRQLLSSSYVQVDGSYYNVTYSTSSLSTVNPAGLLIIVIGLVGLFYVSK